MKTKKATRRRSRPKDAAVQDLVRTAINELRGKGTPVSVRSVAAMTGLGRRTVKQVTLELQRRGGSQGGSQRIHVDPFGTTLGAAQESAQDRESSGRNLPGTGGDAVPIDTKGTNASIARIREAWKSEIGALSPFYQQLAERIRRSNKPVSRKQLDHALIIASLLKDPTPGSPLDQAQEDRFCLEHQAQRTHEEATEARARADAAAAEIAPLQAEFDEAVSRVRAWEALEVLVPDWEAHPEIDWETFLNTPEPPWPHALEAQLSHLGEQLAPLLQRANSLEDSARSLDLNIAREAGLVVIDRTQLIATRTSVYLARQRCTNPLNPDYALYGGRGTEFRYPSVEALVADIGLRLPGTSLDRIDVNGHYEPGNCRWATPTEQTRNRRARRTA